MGNNSAGSKRPQDVNEPLKGIMLSSLLLFLLRFAIIV
jgi:hypothetical protein